MSTEKKSYIFRRFRRLPNGKLLDAQKYGLKAWRIPVDDDQE